MDIGNFDLNRDPESFTSSTGQFIWARAKERHHKATIAEAEARKIMTRLFQK